MVIDKSFQFPQLTQVSHVKSFQSPELTGASSSLSTIISPSAITQPPPSQKYSYILIKMARKSQIPQDWKGKHHIFMTDS
jgi:hypothetical protein